MNTAHFCDGDLQKSNANSGLNMGPRPKIPTFWGSWKPPDSFGPKIIFLGVIGKKQTGTLHQISS